MDLFIDYKTRKQLWASKWGYQYDYDNDRMAGLDTNPMGLNAMLEFNEIEQDFKIGRNRGTVEKLRQINEENKKKQINNTVDQPIQPPGKTVNDPNVSNFTQEQQKQYDDFKKKQEEENKQLIDPTNLNNWVLIDWFDMQYEMMPIDERIRLRVLYQPKNGQSPSNYPRKPTFDEYKVGQKPFNPPRLPEDKPKQQPVVEPEKKVEEENITPRVPRSIKEYNDMLIRREQSFVEKYGGMIIMMSALFIGYSLYQIYNNNAGNRPFINYDGQTVGSLGIGTSAPSISNVSNTSSGGGPGLFSTSVSEVGKTTRSLIEGFGGFAKQLLKGDNKIVRDVLDGVKSVSVDAGKKFNSLMDDVARGGDSYDDWKKKTVPVLIGKTGTVLRDSIVSLGGYTKDGLQKLSNAISQYAQKEKLSDDEAKKVSNLIKNIDDEKEKVELTIDTQHFVKAIKNNEVEEAKTFWEKLKDKVKELSPQEQAMMLKSFLSIAISPMLGATGMQQIIIFLKKNKKEDYEKYYAQFGQYTTDTSNIMPSPTEVENIEILTHQENSTVEKIKSAWEYFKNKGKAGLNKLGEALKQIGSNIEEVIENIRNRTSNTGYDPLQQTDDDDDDEKKTTEYTSYHSDDDVQIIEMDETDPNKESNQKIADLYHILSKKLKIKNQANEGKLYALLKNYVTLKKENELENDKQLFNLITDKPYIVAVIRDRYNLHNLPKRDGLFFTEYLSDNLSSIIKKINSITKDEKHTEDENYINYLQYLGSSIPETSNLLAMDELAMDEPASSGLFVKSKPIEQEPTFTFKPTETKVDIPTELPKSEIVGEAKIRTRTTEQAAQERSAREQSELTQLQDKLLNEMKMESLNYNLIGAPTHRQKMDYAEKLLNLQNRIIQNDQVNKYYSDLNEANKNNFINKAIDIFMTNDLLELVKKIHSDQEKTKESSQLETAHIKLNTAGQTTTTTEAQQRAQERSAQEQSELTNLHDKLLNEMKIESLNYNLIGAPTHRQKIDYAEKLLNLQNRIIQNDQVNKYYSDLNEANKNNFINKAIDIFMTNDLLELVKKIHSDQEKTKESSQLETAHIKLNTAGQTTTTTEAQQPYEPKPINNPVVIPKGPPKPEEGVQTAGLNRQKIIEAVLKRYIIQNTKTNNAKIDQDLENVEDVDDLAKKILKTETEEDINKLELQNVNTAIIHNTSIGYKGSNKQNAKKKQLSLSINVDPQNINNINYLKEAFKLYEDKATEDVVSTEEVSKLLYPFFVYIVGKNINVNTFSKRYLKGVDGVDLYNTIVNFKTNDDLTNYLKSLKNQQPPKKRK